MVNYREILLSLSMLTAASCNVLRGCGTETSCVAPAGKDNYTMAMVILEPAEDPCGGRQLEGTLEIANRVAEEFSARFSAATNDRVTINVEREIYRISGESTLGSWEQVLPAVQSFNRLHNANDRFDFVTLIPMVSRRTEDGFMESPVARHYSIFNTSSRVSYNGASSESCEGLDTQNLIGVNSLGVVFSANDCETGVTTSRIEIALESAIHETAHQWSARFYSILRDYVIGPGQDRSSHFNGRLTNLKDTLNDGYFIPVWPETVLGGPNGEQMYWESTGNGTYKLHRYWAPLANPQDDIIRQKPFSQLTLWAMGALKTEELTDRYLYVHHDFAKDGYYELPPDGTLVKGEWVTAQEVVSGR